jgi:flagellar capping protein FliD
METVMKKILFAILVVLFSISALYSKDDKGADEYKQELKSSDKTVVINACNWFGKNDNKEANEQMIKLIDNKDPEIRMWSAANLGILKEEKALSPLISQLEKEAIADVRYSQILAISRIGVKNDSDKKKLLAIKDKETDPIIKDYILKMEEKFLK